MSIAVMSKVWSKSQHKGNALLLLLAIADNADDSGWCWPGIEYLAKKVKVTPQSIIRITRSLEETHELTVLHNRRTGNKYVVRLGITDEELARVLRTKAVYLDDEQITNILLHNACVTSRSNMDVSSEVTPMLNESSVPVNEPSHVATATPPPTDATGSRCRHCLHPRGVTGGICDACGVADTIDETPVCPDCGKPTATTEQMPDVHNTCTCKQESTLSEHFGERSERPKRKPQPGWMQTAREPWAMWGAQSDEFQRGLRQYHEAGHKVQRLGYDWQRLTQCPLDWGDKQAVKTWSSGLWACLKAAGGDAAIVLDATRKAIQEDLTIANPYSVLKMTQALVGERKRGKPAPKVTPMLDQRGLSKPNPLARRQQR